MLHAGLSTKRCWSLWTQNHVSPTLLRSSPGFPSAERERGSCSGRPMRSSGLRPRLAHLCLFVCLCVNILLIVDSISLAPLCRPPAMSRHPVPVSMATDISIRGLWFLSSHPPSPHGSMSVCPLPPASGQPRSCWSSNAASGTVPGAGRCAVPVAASAWLPRGLSSAETPERQPRGLSPTGLGHLCVSRPTSVSRHACFFPFSISCLSPWQPPSSSLFAASCSESPGLSCETSAAPRSASAPSLPGLFQALALLF